jgi:hypothetical protein
MSEKSIVKKSIPAEWKQIIKKSFAFKEKVFIIFCNLTIITQVISGYMPFE